MGGENAGLQRVPTEREKLDFGCPGVGGRVAVRGEGDHLFGARAEDVATSDAGRVIHDDLVTGMMVGIVWLGVCLIIGPPLGLGRWLQIALRPVHATISGHDEQLAGVPLVAAVHVWRAWIIPGLVFGLSTGLVLAILVASLAAEASGRYAIASLLFGVSGIFPRRPAQFLEWARNSGLLRVTGVAYQFRHDTYQQWLGTGEVDRGVKTALDAHDDSRPWS